MDPQKAPVSFEQLEALDIRLCRILEVTPILKNPKREAGEDNPIKAYKLLIDTGLDQRECVTNIVVHYSPEQLRGILTPFILNLPEQEIRGVKSRAMIVVARTAGLITTLMAQREFTVVDVNLVGAIVLN